MASYFYGQGGENYITAVIMDRCLCRIMSLEYSRITLSGLQSSVQVSVKPVFVSIYWFFHSYAVHVVELLNYYTNHCTYIKFIKFYTLRH